jgi:hypothetical protein
MHSKIRFIVETVSSARDKCGNRYHFARVTSTLTGRSLSYETGGVRNAAGDLYRVAGSYDALYCSELEIPKREWQHARKQCGERYEYNVTAADFLALESSQCVK